jgi:hypothetical protein
VKLFTCELGFKKTNGVQFKFANQKLLSAKAPHIPSSVLYISSRGVVRLFRKQGRCGAVKLQNIPQNLSLLCAPGPSSKGGQRSTFLMLGHSGGVPGDALKNTTLLGVGFALYAGRVCSQFLLQDWERGPWVARMYLLCFSPLFFDAIGVSGMTFMLFLQRCCARLILTLVPLRLVPINYLVLYV